jgi:hypothetical protein
MSQTLIQQPPGSQFPVTSGLLVPFCALTPIIITRPNDVVPYVIGDVFGAVVDARITIPFGIPRGAMFHVRVLAVRNRAPAATNPSLVLWPFFGSKPATTIGDNAPLTLSDADIALLLGPFAASQAPGFSTATGLNFSADPTGRGLSSMATFQGIMPLTGDGSVYAYAWLNSAYTPIALEVLTLYPFVFVF